MHWYLKEFVVKKNAIAVFAAAALVSVAGCSQVNGAGPAPGDARGYGPGWGMMGYGPGYGPGPMMGGYGGGYGPGPMMGGYGPGMMGGGAGWGPGMRGGYGYGALPDLTADQRTKIGDIQREYRARQWPLMQQMHELMWGDGSGTFDEQAQRREYDRVAALQKQMFENALESRKRIDAILTPQQREELRRGPRRPR